MRHWSAGRRREDHAAAAGAHLGADDHFIHSTQRHQLQQSMNGRIKLGAMRSACSASSRTEPGQRPAHAGAPLPAGPLPARPFISAPALPRPPCPPARAWSQLQVAWQRLRQCSEDDVAVEGAVVGTNRGGIIVEVENIRGFCPGSQLGQVGAASRACWVLPIGLAGCCQACRVLKTGLERSGQLGLLGTAWLGGRCLARWALLGAGCVRWVLLSCFMDLMGAGLICWVLEDGCCAALFCRLAGIPGRHLALPHAATLFPCAVGCPLVVLGAEAQLQPRCASFAGAGQAAKITSEHLTAQGLHFRLELLPPALSRSGHYTLPHFATLSGQGQELLLHERRSSVQPVFVHLHSPVNMPLHRCLRKRRHLLVRASTFSRLHACSSIRSPCLSRPSPLSLNPPAPCSAWRRLRSWWAAACCSR